MSEKYVKIKHVKLKNATKGIREFVVIGTIMVDASSQNIVHIVMNLHIVDLRETFKKSVLLRSLLRGLKP